MRWLLDEGIPKDVATFLRARDDDVLVVPETPYRSQPDEVLWQVAGCEQRIVVTEDRTFARPDFLPFPAGLIVVRVPGHWKATMITEFVVDAIRRLPEQSLLGVMTVLEPGRIRQRPLADLPHGRRSD